MVEGVEVSVTGNAQKSVTLRKVTPAKKYKGPAKLVWTPEAIEAFEYCQQAIANCQELFFLEDTATPILQTDASDHGIGGYLFMITNGIVGGSPAKLISYRKGVLRNILWS